MKLSFVGDKNYGYDSLLFDNLQPLYNCKLFTMRIRSFLSFTLLLFGLSIVLSCNNQATDTEASATEGETAQMEVEKKWDELKEEYHTVMAGTFHPAEDGDLEPVKTMYDELAQKAKAWADAPLPEMHTGKNFDQSLAELVNSAEEIGDMVDMEASDEDLTKALFALHDIFHAIQGQCDDEH